MTGISATLLGDSTPIVTLDIDPFGEAFLAEPYVFHHTLRDAGPVVWLRKYGIYGAARYDEVAAALKDHETFCSGRGVGLADFAREEPWRPPSLLLEVDPPLHDRTRGLMNRIASVVDLKRHLPLWQSKATALVDTLVQRGSFDAVPDLAEAYPLQIFPDLIGLPDAGRENLIVYATAVFNAFGPRNAIFESGNAKATDSTQWVAQSCKRDNLKPDGWGMAVYEASDDGLCTPEEAERLVRSFLSAGVDTTVNGIANMLYALALHPEQWALVRSDPAKYRKKLFEESLRWDSTVQTFFRTTTRDTVLGGCDLPEGSKILLFLAAANRDPRHWTEAEAFDVRRQSSGHVGFGFGIHQCLGQMVARFEAECLIDAMIPACTSIRLAGIPERRLNNTLRAFGQLPIVLN